MSRFDEFADSLHTEVVTEMAESYFGARKNIDDMVEALDSWAQELRLWEPRLARAAARLHALLLDQETVRAFYISLDILPGCIPFPEKGTEEAHVGPLPFAFTERGRYVKCVQAAYADFQRLANDYLNGRYFQDPKVPGRKRLTVHYIRFKAMFEYINEEILRVNGKMNTGDTLRYLKGMDPELLEKERTLEACIGDYCALGNEMEYKLLEMARYELLEIQELPSSETIRSQLHAFCRGLWGERREDVRRVLEEVKRSPG